MEVEKGDVFWFDIKQILNLKAYKTNICLKNRPYLVSATNNNLVTIAPIKTRKKSYDKNIVICSLDGITCSTIILEQIITIDVDLLLADNFICKLQEKTLEKVDEALISYLGLNHLLDNTNQLALSKLISIDILGELEKIINKIIEKKIKEKTSLLSEQVDNVVLQIADNLEDLFSTNETTVTPIEPATNETDIINESKKEVTEHEVKEENPGIIEENFTTKKEPTEEEPLINNDTSSENNEKQIKNKIKPLDLARKGGNIVWNGEIRKTFIEHSKIYTASEMCKLYKFKNPESYHATLRKQKKLFIDYNEKFQNNC